MKIVNSHAMTRNDTDLPYTHYQVSPNGNVSKTIVQYHCQDINFGQSINLNSNFPNFVCTNVWICLVLYNFITSVCWWKPQSRNTIVPSPWKFIATPTAFQYPLLNPWQQLISSPFLKFCIFLFFQKYHTNEIIHYVIFWDFFSFLTIYYVLRN